jgi:TPR repeat protein
MGGASLGELAAQNVVSAVSPAEADTKCGEAFRAGDGAQALLLCRRGAEAGYANSQAMLVTLYSNGKAVPRDFTQAVFWTRKAADQGDVRGQNFLAIMYRGGLGVPKDYGQAMMWAHKAAAQNSAIGQYTLGLLYGNGWGIAQDYRESAKWHRLAADQGDDDAQLILGSYYELGRGVPRDHAAALQWFGKAADQGNEKGKDALRRLQLTEDKPPERPSGAPSHTDGEIQLFCTAKNGETGAVLVGADQQTIQYGKNSFRNGAVVSLVDDDPMAAIMGRSSAPYQTKQYVAVNDDAIEFGDPQHTYRIDRSTGVLQIEYYKQFPFAPIHCQAKKNKF